MGYFRIVLESIYKQKYLMKEISPKYLIDFAMKMTAFVIFDINKGFFCTLHTGPDCIQIVQKIFLDPNTLVKVRKSHKTRF